MRKPTDICLLCQVNPATKTKSHIYPKFISTNFLGNKGTGRRGYDLSSDKILEDKPRVIQDSPKEDYILCDECEAYFSVLEGISSDTFINWRNKVDNGDYTLKHVIDQLDVVECNTADKATIYLLIYSIFWRVSISSISLFKNVKLASDFEEELRTTLMTYKNEKKNDYLNALNSKPNFKIFPTAITTANSFADETANMLFAPFSYDPYCLVVDRFGFMLFRTSHEIKHIIKNFTNTTINDCKIMIFSEQLWFDTFLKRPFELLAKQALEQKKKI
ncbi:hypothetical protein [Parafilimonas sp.]|uniref:hypothetical protein n=1 Tax=Parafilimonas sp. TaxID=1969739 RepID=UPI0039E2449A